MNTPAPLQVQQQCWQQILNLLSDQEFSFRPEHWPSFCKLVDWHHILLDVLPKLAANSESHGFSVEQIQQLDSEALIKRKNLLLLGQLQEQISEAFNASGIRALFFKGIVAGEWLYGSSIARQCRDIDMVVHTNEHAIASKKLEEMGCIRIIPRADISRSGYKRYQRAMKDVSYVHQKSGALIELHWRLRPFPQAFHFEFDSAWEKHREIMVDGQPINSFDDSLHTRYLAAHGCNSHWGRLRWLLDWHRLSTLDMDWQKIISHCQNDREKSHLRKAFLLANRQLGTSFPAAVDAIKPSIGERYTLNTQALSQAEARYPSWPQRQLLNLATQQNIKGMFGYCSHMLKKSLAADTLKPGN